MRVARAFTKHQSRGCLGKQRWWKQRGTPRRPWEDTNKPNSFSLQRLKALCFFFCKPYFSPKRAWKCFMTFKTANICFERPVASNWFLCSYNCAQSTTLVGTGQQDPNSVLAKLLIALSLAFSLRQSRREWRQKQP